MSLFFSLSLSVFGSNYSYMQQSYVIYLQNKCNCNQLQLLGKNALLNNLLLKMLMITKGVTSEYYMYYIIFSVKSFSYMLDNIHFVALCVLMCTMFCCHFQSEPFGKV